MLVSVAFSLSF